LSNVWVRSYGGQTDVSARVVGKGVKDYQYGVDLGVDHFWQLDADNDLYTGVFLGYGNDDYHVRTGYANSGELGGYYTGVYGTWLHESGWYADVAAKAQHFDHHFDARDMSNNRTTADYESWGLGASLELGRKFKFRAGWFIEPQLQASYAHFTNSGYWTGGANRFAVNISAADVVQLRAGGLFGRTLRLAGGGFLQPYLKVSGVEQISAGGKLRATGGEWRQNLDGARAEIGAGIIWQLDENNQFHIDYEAAFGDKYDKPFGINFGYRHQF
jgi:outer membrane autotransporter protein